MNKYLIEQLKKGRLKKELRQSDVSEVTGIKPNTLSNYENGVSEPDIDTYLMLCKLYDLDYAYILEKAYDLKNETDIILNQVEEEFMKKYRTLNESSKDIVETILNNEYNHMQELKEQLTIDKNQNRRYDSEHSLDIPITYPKTDYLTGLSAGTGLYVFDDIPTQVIQVSAKYKDADFVIGVSGDSMEPTYHDGDKVAVKKAPTINIGEVGVFMVDGNGYIKEFGKNKLISHNKVYDDIIIDDDTTCIGKVVGKI